MSADEEKGYKDGYGGYGSTTTDVHTIYDPTQESKWTRRGFTLESFKRAPASTGGQVVTGEQHVGTEAVTDAPMLQQKFKNRHLQMIAVGGSIGTGLFIGSGSALSDGGPGGVLIAWAIMGIMLLNTCQAIGEMAIMYPVSGGYYTLVDRFVDPSWAFAMGWNYFLQWAVVLPLELVAASFTLRYWDSEGTVPVAVWISMFAVIVIILNFFPTGYAEEEFWTSVLKLTVIVIFLFAAFVFVLGGGPSSGRFGEYYGARLFYDPGAFPNGFKGLCSVFVTAAFSFAGTELVGLAAAEHPNPRKALPSAVKLTFWRISFVYLMSLTFASLLVPSDSPDLIGGSYDANTSPFVLVFDYANVDGLPHLINATITISVLSIGMSCVYAGSRVLLALSEQGYAPSWFNFVDKAGRPWRTIGAVIIFFPVAYAYTNDRVGGIVFDWLLALSGLSTIFTWMSINIAHIRFRRAWRVQGHSLDELPFRALGGIWGSWFAVLVLSLVLIAQFYVAIWPLGGTAGGSDAAESFFLAYLAAPIVIAFYIVGVVWKRTAPRKASEIDLVSGRKCWATAEELDVGRRAAKELPWIKYICYALFGAFDPK